MLHSRGARGARHLVLQICFRVGAGGSVGVERPLRLLARHAGRRWPLLLLRLCEGKKPRIDTNEGGS